MSEACDEYLQFALKAARRAGKIILDKQGCAAVSEKATNNLVTEADIASQEMIVNLVREHFPGHGIVAEEQDLSACGSDENLWIIDPLDGTNNYAHLIPHYCVSLAYAFSGSVEVGVVYDPVREEMFTARRGRGAFLNGKPIEVSRAFSLDQAVVAVGFYYDRGRIMRKTLKSIEKLFDSNIQGIRRQGSAALDLCWVACGRFDAYFEYTLATWDFAAGMLIVTEAGGRCTDQAGKLLDLSSTGVTVSNGLIHDDFLNLVGWSGK